MPKIMDVVLMIFSTMYIYAQDLDDSILINITVLRNEKFKKFNISPLTIRSEYKNKLPFASEKRRSKDLHDTPCLKMWIVAGVTT